MLELRPYQLESIDRLRDGVRAGHNRQLLCAPTAAGKTVVATKLMQDAAGKGSRACFVCDRVALIDQTSATFDRYGIAHGVVQGSHWRCRPWERIQVASAQTLARRGVPNGLQLLVVDEAHTVYRSVSDLIEARKDLIVIGLTATPFTRGLAKLYSNVVNVVTTHELLDQGWLTPIKPYAAKSLDMRGAKLKFDGEWAEAEIEKRGMVIVGDIVREWIEKTNLHFKGSVKTLVFSATVAHGGELCRQFQEQGFNFQQISYKDGNDDRRRALIEEFRKPDSEIVGLVSCEALAKGFDVPDVRCGISARPYRKSLSGHIQQLGRVMRLAEGKEFALWLCHSGNYLRFLADTEEFFADGMSQLDDGALDSKVRREVGDDEKPNFACGACGYVMGARATHCPACGWERPRRRVEVENEPGKLVALESKRAGQPPWMLDRDRVWAEICGFALQRKHGDVDAAERFAKAQYRSLYGVWPRHAMRNIEPLEPRPEVARKVQQQLIAHFKRRAA